jgi:DHA2 family multidrug resistance protein-like MFS transporter
MLPANIVLLVGSVVGPVLARKTSSGNTIVVGLVICSAGLLLHTMAGTGWGMVVLVAGMAVASFGIMLPSTVTMTVMLGAAPPERAGSAASMSEASGEFGVAVGVASLGSLGTVVYRGGVEDGLAGLPAQAADAARDSLAGALAAAQALPGPVGSAVAEVARASFTDAVHVVGVVGAAAFLVVAVVAAVVFRPAAA